MHICQCVSFFVRLCVILCLFMIVRIRVCCEGVLSSCLGAGMFLSSVCNNKCVIGSSQEDVGSIDEQCVPQSSCNYDAWDVYLSQLLRRACGPQAGPASARYAGCLVSHASDTLEHAQALFLSRSKSLGVHCAPRDAATRAEGRPDACCPSPPAISPGTGEW